MPFSRSLPRLLLALLLPIAVGATGPGCSSVAKRPCTQGGQPAHGDGKPGKGNKQCEQAKDAAGNFVNHGRYIEWYPSGKRAMEGEYLSGSKHGKWTEWDEQARKVSEKWYENGVEVEGREAQPYNGLSPQPRPSAKPPSR